MESVPPSSIGSCCMAIEIKTGRASTVRVHGNPQQKQATKSCANPKVGRNNWRTQHIYWLVVYLPLWKIWVRQLGWWHSQLNGQIKNVPNHQAVIVSGFLNSLIAGGASPCCCFFPESFLGLSAAPATLVLRSRGPCWGRSAPCWRVASRPDHWCLRQEEWDWMGFNRI